MEYQFLMLLTDRVNRTIAPLDAGTLVSMELHHCTGQTIGLIINGVEVLPDNFPSDWLHNMGQRSFLMLDCFGRSATIEVRLGNRKAGAAVAVFTYKKDPCVYMETPVRYHISHYPMLDRLHPVQVTKHLNSGTALGVVGDFFADWEKGEDDLRFYIMRQFKSYAMLNANMHDGSWVHAPLCAISPYHCKSIEKGLWRLPAGMSMVELSIDPVDGIAREELENTIKRYKGPDVTKAIACYTLCIVEDKKERAKAS